MYRSILVINHYPHFQKLYRIRTLISVFRSFSCILKSLEVSLLFLLLSHK
uniref:Uncharacterized protein n=1 Tax=Heterorhabditis bacteriophora TaxID=37862 RepID=A0A1I7WIK7_HETBA